jgi:hypothetical protein
LSHHALQAPTVPTSFLPSLEGDESRPLAYIAQSHHGGLLLLPASGLAGKVFFFTVNIFYRRVPKLPVTAKFEILANLPYELIQTKFEFKFRLLKNKKSLYPIHV